METVAHQIIAADRRNDVNPDLVKAVAVDDIDIAAVRRQRDQTLPYQDAVRIFSFNQHVNIGIGNQSFVRIGKIGVNGDGVGTAIDLVVGETISARLFENAAVSQAEPDFSPAKRPPLPISSR